jgi:soluble lytic murein transglycosylase-like protein
MNQSFSPSGAPTPNRDGAREARGFAARPDRFAILAVLLAVVAMIAGAASAEAGSGGISSGDDSSRTGGDRYDRVWDGYSDRNKRWARRTSECESGGDPDAVSPGGTYRGAFQFMRSTWRNSPKSPGGDPIRYRWKTQAVVAVALKKRDGAGHWPNCG